MWAIRADTAFDGAAFRPGGATVLIDDGQIVGVEDVGYVVPDGCRLVDHHGAVLPGLIDTHTHLVGDSRVGALDRVAGYSADELESVLRAALAAHLAAGVTTVRDMGDRDFAVVDRARRTGEPTVVAAGPPITSPAGHCFYLGGEVDGQDAIHAAVADRVEHGAQLVKVMASGGMLTPGSDQLGSQFSDADLRLIVELGHAAGLPVVAHAHPLTAVRQALAAAVDGIEHCSCLTEKGQVVEAEIFDALATAGVVVCVTAGGDVRDQGAPPPHIQTMLTRIGLTVDQVFGRKADLLAQLYRSGVRFTCGVDSGIAPIKAHGTVAASMIQHFDAGIPITDVLAGATSVSADVCALPAKGRLRAGMDADMVLLDGDVRTDVAALGRVAGVVLSGQMVVGPDPTAQPAAPG
jgi:imidazolonepropionase-like amidohydrolase